MNSIFFFQKSNFCISLLVLVISFQLFGCYFHLFFFFVLLSWVSYELGWGIVMVLRMLWYCAQIVFLSQNLGYHCIYLIYDLSVSFGCGILGMKSPLVFQETIS